MSDVHLEVDALVRLVLAHGLDYVREETTHIEPLVGRDRHELATRMANLLLKLFFQLRKIILDLAYEIQGHYGELDGAQALLHHAHHVRRERLWVLQAVQGRAHKPRDVLHVYELAHLLVVKSVEYFDLNDTLLI